MLTYILMFVILLFLAFIVIYRDKAGKATRFFDLDTTNSMRGFWCIVVLLVHTPEAYLNPIQDAIGSFAYIGVTFFFMTSSYGLTLSALKSPQKLMTDFWKRRLTKLLLPMVMISIISFTIHAVCDGEFNFISLISINKWVRVLLVFYLFFWLVYKFTPQEKSIEFKSIIIILITILFAVAVYLTDGLFVFGWHIESFGFVWGILLALFKDKFEKSAGDKWFLKTLILFVLSAVFGVLYLKTKNIVFLGDFVVKLILGAVILSLILTLNYKFSIGNPVSRFLGSISYEVYLVHPCIFVLLQSLPFDMNSGVIISLCIVISIIVSTLVNRLSSLTLKTINK